MLKFITSIFLLLISSAAIAQDSLSVETAALDTVNVQKVSEDSTVYRQRYGLRIGIDLSKPIRSLVEDGYRGLELLADFRISHNVYIAGALGNEEKTRQEDNYNFTTSGSYLKIGLDWNTYENWYGMENIINLGFRVGASTFTQTLNSYQIYNTNQYWGETQSGIMGEDMLGEFSGLNAQWAEIVLGMKVELVRNVFMGASVRLNYLINNSEAGNFPNLFIPGFNKVTDGSNFGVGYNYSISYLIPIFKSNKPQKENPDQTTQEEEEVED